MIPASSFPASEKEHKRGSILRGEVRKEIALIAFLFLVFLIVATLLSAQLFPVWLDEVLLTDPAANLWLGNGFTSSAWYYQVQDEFWACNSPLYPFLLFFWLKLFGFGVTSARSLNYLLIVASMGLIWWAVYRLDLIVTMRDRLIAVFLLLFSAGISFSYLSGRYDCLAILLFSALILTYSFQPSLWQKVAFASIGFLVPLSGFHLLPYAVIMAVLLFIYLGRPVIYPAVATFGGMIMGIASMLLLYAQQGVLKVFVSSLGGHSLVGIETPVGDASNAQKAMYVLSNLLPILATRFSGIVRWYTGDKTFVFLYLAALVLACIQLYSKRMRLRSPLTFALLSGLVVPLLMGLARDYPAYYAWMALLPLTLGIAATLIEWRGTLLRRPAMLVVVLLLIAAMIPGLPTQLVPAFANLKNRDYQRVEQFVQNNIAPDEAVYSDFGPYYAIRRQVNFVLFPTYLDMMTEADKTKLSTALIDTKQSHHNYKDIEIFNALGGSWEEAEEKLDTTQFNLRIFRRSS
ncbi:MULTISPECIES: hypothetical protein [Cyanophyceae]|uniref:hypothetical protein n=1 Tax=Cyanophyceae TaxID=3028117 RepID=UPI0016872A7D|nr:MULTISPECIES: hypothetical protein [Cyanophyceae]MBD1917094.1 hypothetical protein [Phormidium sp. FACHB-77]MBD2030625.1 hypothetical protein [Phormidium sp. FACHB-322]MBD2050267.1 hypothetical protein [Leptolyngbya sp. FACHB-60]